MIDILKRATGNMQSARVELAEAIRFLESEDVAEANLALQRATGDIRKAFGGIADCILADFDKDEGEPPSWWK
jgi:cellobiose-specific phosphotransferase system component IIA